MDTTALPEILLVPHLAAALSLSDGAVRDLLGRGEIPGCKIGRQWVTRRKALLDHLEALEHEEQQHRSVDIETVAASVRRAGRPRDLERQIRAARGQN